jgi:diacylglycerol kinase (ATP)
LRAKLIFNSSSGKTDESANQLLEVVTELQKHNIVPEVYHFDDIEIIRTAVKRAKKDGTELILASGGDGTVDAVAGEIAGTELTLGIIPTGTANNLALNLKIPRSIPEAVSVLRNGTRVQADLGTVQTGGKKRYFLELVTWRIRYHLRLFESFFGNLGARQERDRQHCCLLRGRGQHALHRQEFPP